LGKQAEQGCPQLLGAATHSSDSPMCRMGPDSPVCEPGDGAGWRGTKGLSAKGTKTSLAVPICKVPGGPRHPAPEWPALYWSTQPAVGKMLQGRWVVQGWCYRVLWRPSSSQCPPLLSVTPKCRGMGQATPFCLQVPVRVTSSAGRARINQGRILSRAWP
jgi:hypothetical protein